MSATAVSGRGRRKKKENRKSLLWLTEAQAALSWGIILILVALLGAIYLYQTSQIAGVGRHVQLLQNELDEVKRVNSDLERNIAEAQSLENLQAEARRLGFVRTDPADVEYLVVTDYPPLIENSSSSAPIPSPAEPAAGIQEAVLLLFKSSVGDLMRGESP